MTVPDHDVDGRALTLRLTFPSMLTVSIQEPDATLARSTVVFWEPVRLFVATCDVVKSAWVPHPWPVDVGPVCPLCDQPRPVQEA